MADVNANIGVNIDTSQALAQLKSLQRQISQFHTSIARSSESAALAQRSLQKNLVNSINSIGAFSAELRTVRTSAETFTNSLEKNKFGMREYFRYAGASTKTFGRLFKTEFDTIGKVAEERVKTLQTQYIKLGRDASGAMQAIAVRPTALNMQDYGVKTAIAAQKQALFNQLMKQGTTNLLNFGKNTQWAGRQLMVGFTIPLSIVASTAAKTFMEMEAQTIKFRKVYGDLFTPKAETDAALDSIIELGKQFTKYGVAVSQTVALSAEAAAAGFQGLDLQRQTTEATRLSILGQIDSQKSLETTISLQNAFGMSSDKLADSINFLNAVENQTVVSLDDITTAIPKVAPVVQQLGGDVKDLTFFIAAMKEGGINASEGANALKSGLGALINPTEKASDMLKSFGINATAIIEKNKGNLKATVIEFANALNALDPLSRARAIEQMFGKFQFARLSTLFANVAKDGNQASRVLDLANASVEELSELSEQELGMTADSSMNKFRKSVEDLKLALVPVGKSFLEAATPIVEFVGGVLEKFGNLSDGTKRLITLLTVGIGAVGPIFLMTFGLLMNALANTLKLFGTLRSGFLRLTGQSKVLGEQTQYLNSEQLEAAAAAHSLDQTHAKLTQTFNVEREALIRLIATYQSANVAAKNFAFNNPGMMMPGKATKKFADGIISVPGPKGAGDIVPAMVSPGEAIIPSKMAKKYAPLIQGIIADNIPGYQLGKGFKNATMFLPESINTLMGQLGGRGVATAGVSQYIGGAGGGVMAPLLAVIARDLKVGINNPKFKSEFATVANLFAQTAADALNKSGKQFIKDADLEAILVPALRNAAKGIKIAGKNIDVALENAINEIRTVGPVGVGSGSMGGTGRTSFAGSYRSARSAAQRFAMEQNPEAFRQTERFSQNRGRTVRSFQTLDPMLNQWQVATMSHITTSITASAENLTRQMTPHLGDVGARVTRAITRNVVQGAIQEARVASPSRQTKMVGASIAQGFISGAQEYVDDAKRVGQQLGAGMVQTASGLYVPGGMVGQSAKTNVSSVPLSVITENARRNREQLLELQKNKTSNRFENTRGMVGRGMGRRGLAGIGGATMAASMLPGKAGEIGMKVGSAAFLAQSLMMLPGPLKLVAVAFGGLYGITKLLAAAKEKERQAIEGLGKAANLSKTQIEKLGGTLGFTPIKSNLEQSKTPVSGISVERSQEIENTKKLLEEDPEFKNQISALKNATNQQAEIIFRSLALRLTGQGATKEQIENYIYLLQQEAGKTDVKFDLKSIDLSTKEGQTGLQNSVDVLLKDYKSAFDKGYKKTKVFVPGGRGTVGAGMKEIEVISKDLKTKLSTTANVISNTFMSLDTQLRSGKINADQFNQSFDNISKSINSMPKAEGLFLMQEILKTLPSELAKAAGGLKDTSNQLLIVKAAALGVAVSAEMIQALLIAETDKSADAQIRASTIKAELEKKMQVAQKVIADVLKKSGGVSGGKKETDDLTKKIKAMKEQIEVFNLLVSKQIAYKDALEISNDASLREIILNAERTKTLDKVLPRLKKLLRLETSLNNIQDKTPITDPEEILDLQEKVIDIRYRGSIQQGEAAVKNAEKVVDDIEKEIDGIEKSIEKKRRNIEILYDRPIQALQDEGSILSNNLKLIDTATDEINKKYDTQINALEKISSINEEIANQEKSRLNIATALTSGDVAAAAQAVQDARAQAASSRLEKQKAGIEASRGQAIAELTAGGMTKDQISQRQLAIEKQIFNLDQQKNAATLAIRLQEDQIYSIQKGKLQVAQDSLIAAQDALKKINDQKDADLAFIAQRKQFFADQKTLQAIANADVKDYETKVDAAKKTADALLKTILGLNTTVETVHVIRTIKKEMASGADDSGSSGAGGSGGSGAGGSGGSGAGGSGGSGAGGSGGSDKGGSDKNDKTKPGSNFTYGAGNPLFKPKVAPKSNFTYGAGNPFVQPKTKKMYGGLIKPMNIGGMVPKYFAVGGRMGSDSVPAMLTPGEFVMNKRASKEFGPLLSMLNESKYPSMIGPSYGTNAGSSRNISIRDNSTDVYNYNVGISVGGTNVSADQIAKTVMNEIKYLDSQRVRGQRVS